MSAFKTWRAFWNFEREVSRNRRYVRSVRAEEFLKAVRVTCESRREQIEKGQGLWRAQHGHEWRRIKEIDDPVPCAYPPKRMVPTKDRALEGRANSKGIPALYLSNCRIAAMSEVRPWLGSFVSLGHFEIARPLSVVDCRRYHNRKAFYFWKEPPPEDLDKAVWSHIDRAFAKPVTRNDETGDYVATQTLTELFRDLGFDGVAYKSAFGSTALNIALFDLDAARLTSCSLYEVKGARLKFDECDGPYWVAGAAKTKRANPKRKKSKVKPVSS